MARRGRDAWWSTQPREPNWALLPRRVVRNKDTMPSNCTAPGMCMPDSLGCAQFGQPVVIDRTKCNYVRLPTSLQWAEITAFYDLIADAVSGKFTTTHIVHVSQCPPLHRSYPENTALEHIMDMRHFPYTLLPVISYTTFSYTGLVGLRYGVFSWDSGYTNTHGPYHVLLRCM